jgi:hypothetical protein
LGKELARKSKILFCGIVRNVENTLRNNIDRIRYLAKYFDQYDIFVYENDSIDRTKNILEQAGINYKSENRADSDYRNKEDNNHYYRCCELSSCRNEYIKYARNYCSNFDYICVLDWDIYGWSYKGFFDSIYRLSNDPKLASVSAYGVLSEPTNTQNIENNIDNLLMYDSFAFRPLGCIHHSWLLQPSPNFYKPDKPVAVRSNFNGIAIYKKLLMNFDYSVKLEADLVDCDHVYINDEISKSGYGHLLNNYLVASYSKHKHCFI